MMCSVLSVMCLSVYSVSSRTDKQDIRMYAQAFHAHVDYQTLYIVSHYRHNAKQERHLYCIYVYYTYYYSSIYNYIQTIAHLLYIHDT